MFHVSSVGLTKLYFFLEYNIILGFPVRWIPRLHRCKRWPYMGMGAGSARGFFKMGHFIRNR